MRHISLLIAGIVLVGALAFTVLGRVSASVEDTAHSAPAQVEKIAGTELNRITLSPQAAERIGIAMAPVQGSQSDGAAQTTIPYAAVIYDKDGGAWAYTSREPLVFVREQISVDRIDGGTAILSAGPEAGTEVVTVGAAELVGAERYGH